MAEKTVFGLDLIIDDLRGDRGDRFVAWNRKKVSFKYEFNNNSVDRI